MKSNADSTPSAPAPRTLFWWMGVIGVAGFGVYCSARFWSSTSAVAVANLALDVAKKVLSLVFATLCAVWIAKKATADARSDPPPTQEYQPRTQIVQSPPPQRHCRHYCDQGLESVGTEFAVLRHWLTCDGPSCRRTNPQWRCANCRQVYYCSHACQRAHWTTEHYMHCEDAVIVARGSDDDSCEFALSLYKDGVYDLAICEATMVLSARRSTPGAHRIVAMALWTMSKQQATANELIVVQTEAGGQVYTATLDCAIEVMFKGLVYEEPWNGLNTSINRTCLQKLCDLKASGVSIDQDSHGRQLVRGTKRKNKWNKKRSW